MTRIPRWIGIAAAAIAATACDGDRGPAGEPGGAGDMGEEGEPGPPGTCGASEVLLPGSSTFPEGIAAAADGTLYVGSLTSGEVFSLGPCDLSPSSFADVGEVSAVGMVVDPDEGALWVCAASSSSGEDPEIVGYALADGAELARHPFADGAGFCNDLVLDPDGNLVATDSFGDRLMVVAAADRMTDGSDATEWLSDPAFESEGFGLNGIAVDPEGTIFFSKFDTGEIFRVGVDVSGAPSGLTEIAVDPPLEGPDGLEVLEDGTLLVVEGFVGQLSAVALDGDTGESIVISNRLDGPTTAAVAGDSAWVVEGQVSDLTGGTQPAVPFRVVRVPL
jgi:sugar lactone lactonase YvrE